MSETGYEDNPSKFELFFAEDGAALETAKETITAAFVFIQDEHDDLLVMKNERGFDIAGGHREGDETIEETAHREALEEACATIDDLTFYAFIKNGDTAMAVFTASPIEIREFIPDEDDPTSDRTLMSVADFRQAYSGGDKTMMNKLLDRLPSER